MYIRLVNMMLEGETQFATQWLQMTVMWCLMWGLAGTITGASRLTFDSWFRQVLLDQNPAIPRPKIIKLAKNQIFPEKESVFSWYYDKKNNGTWLTWLEAFEKSAAPLSSFSKVRSR